MFGWLKKAAPEPALEHSHGLVRLTESEMKYIAQTDKCPDCGTGDLLTGPRGGTCVNVLCETCKAKFNLGIAPGFGFFFAERLAEPTGFVLIGS